MNAHGVPGWMHPEQLDAIAALARDVKPKTVVEIGSFIGRSAVAWAECLPDATVWCVDPWEEEVRSHVWIDHINPKPTDEEMSEPVSSVFLKYTQDYKNIRPIRCRSWELLGSRKIAPGSADLVFVDGDHTKSGVRTDLAIADWLLGGRGTIAGHDYDAHAQHQGLVEAVKEFAADKRAQIHTPAYAIFCIHLGNSDA